MTRPITQRGLDAGTLRAIADEMAREFAKALAVADHYAGIKATFAEQIVERHCEVAKFAKRVEHRLRRRATRIEKAGKR